MPDVPFACDMNAIPLEKRAAHHALIRHLVDTATTRARPTGDGFVLSLPATAFDDVARFISHERLCCPFLRFSLDLESNGGPIHLCLSGPPGAAEFIGAELGLVGP